MVQHNNNNKLAAMAEATATAEAAPPAGPAGDAPAPAASDAPAPAVVERTLEEVAAASLAAAAAARAAPGRLLSTLSGATVVEMRQYGGEVELPRIIEMIAKDLSEPYSVYTYRFFTSQWPHLCMSVRIS